MMISKPPKKRYLENGAFCYRVETSVATQDQQTTNACSALLELAMSSDAPRPHLSSSKPNASGETVESPKNQEGSSTKPEQNAKVLSQPQEKKVSHQQIINCVVENSIGCYEKANLNHEREHAKAADPAVDCKLFTADPVNDVKSEPIECCNTSASGPDAKPDANYSLPFADAASLKPWKEKRPGGSSETWGKNARYREQVKVPERRKSQRKGKGNRYQAFILEGILQPAKDKRCINGTAFNGHSRKQSPSSKEQQAKRTEAMDAEDADDVSMSEAGSAAAIGGIRSPARSIFGEEEKIAAIPQASAERLTGNRKKRRRRGNPSASSPNKQDGTSSDLAHKRPSSSSAAASVTDAATSQHLVGSQKRKARKRCITHLSPAKSTAPEGTDPSENNDNFSGLVTLARAATENTQPEEHRPSP